MFSNSNLFITIALYCGIGIISALEDGDFYKIIHPSSGKVLTVGSNGVVDGADIILSVWNNEPNQKWLAVQAVVSGDSYLLLTQQQRWNWNHFLRNGEALRETKERHNSLPDWSLVLNGDTRGQTTVQPRDSKKYQQWKSEVAASNSGSTKVIIKNLQDNKCLQAPGSFSSQGSQSVDTTPAPTASPGFFRRVRNWFGGLFGGSSSSSTTTTVPTTTTTTARPNQSQNTATNVSSNKVTLTTCDMNNAGQQWVLEKLSIR